jgi:D-lactate dehydrogenase
MSRLADADPHGADLRELREQYDYDALATCATDGLCALACPVRIDTGALVRRLRAEAHAPWKRTLARYAAAHYAWVEAAARGALRAGRLLGLRSGGASLPAPARRLAAPAEVPGADAVIFVSCVSRIIGAPAGETLPVSLVMQRVAARAGRQLTRTATPAGTCCGLAFASKGWTDAATIALTAAVDRLWTATDGGRLPVVIDNSPCAAHLAHPLVALDPVRRERHARIRWLDGVEYAHIELLDRLDPELLAGTAIVHPVCSVRKAGRQAQLVAILARCHERATVPISTGCCGFAGDTGFRLPELSASATRAEAMEIAELGTGAGYSSSRTCELALERSTGRVFRSFWYALDRATRDRRQGRENSLSSR